MTESDPSTVVKLLDVVQRGDLLDSLIAIRDLLADDADSALWDKHRAECKCVCGMVDVRARVAIVKQLHVVLDAIAAKPGAKEATAVDGIVARAAAKRDELAARRANRVSGSASS